MENDNFEEFDNKINRLENITYVSLAEKILITVTLVGIILLFLEIPGALITIIFSMVSFTFLYILFSFAILTGVGLRRLFKRERYIELSKLKIAGAIFVGFNLGMTILGALSKIMSWPGSTVLLTSGLTFLAISLIVICFKNIKSNPTYKIILRRIIIVGSIGLIAYLISEDITERINYYKSQSRSASVFLNDED